ncbi:hypothetical protein [Jatrophihabitans sp.]|uniref:hypothetical protein n=1 Tax=Jatrophihabitans sp. TaxID=1932789 RepID=UPI0030C7703B|nr:hypothetical protein [Jatrophihabitans sp.]
MPRSERLARADWTFWLPCLFSALAVVATVASIINSHWIESVVSASPDGGSGESEWGISVLVGAVAVASLAVTHWRWRALRPATP